MVKRVVHKIRDILFRCFPLHYAAMVSSVSTIQSSNNRHLRKDLLRWGIAQLQRAMRLINYDHSFLVYYDKVFFYSDGILLHADEEDRYLKLSQGADANEAKKMDLFLRAHHIPVYTVVDLGANYGEITLFFAKQYPQAKIIAVEASSHSFTILKEACAIQFFPTQNIILLHEAVSDKEGMIDITTGLYASNTTIFQEQNEIKRSSGRETVPANTLCSYFKRFGLQTIDFLKVDIEGAEPLLLESFRQCLDRIKSIYLEISWKNTPEYYAELAKLLFDTRACYDENGARIDSFEILEQQILSVRKITGTLNVWFV